MGKSPYLGREIIEAAMKVLGTTKNDYVLVVGDRNVARYKQGYTDQGRGKENYLFAF